MSPLELYFTAFSGGGEGRCQKRDSSAYWRERARARDREAVRTTTGSSRAHLDGTQLKVMGNCERVVLCLRATLITIKREHEGAELSQVE